MLDLLIGLTVILAAAWAAARLGERVGMPAVLAELAAGIVIGPALLGFVEPQPALETLAALGVMLLVFLIGLRTDPVRLRRAMGTAAWPAGLAFALPFASGVAVVLALGGSLEGALLTGSVLSTTSLAATSRILLDIRALGTPAGQRLVATALVVLILTLVGFAVVSAILEAGGLGWREAAVMTARAGAFALLVAVVARWVVPAFVVGRDASLLLDGFGPFTRALVLAIGLAAASEAAGLSMLPGAFAAGLFVRRAALTEAMHDAVVGHARGLSIGFLTPVFFVSAGFDFSFDVFSAAPGMVAAIVGVAFVSKLAGGLLGARLAGLPVREGWVLGAGLNARGGVDILIAQAGLGLGVIDAGIFSALLLASFVTTFLAPPLLRRALRDEAGTPAEPEPARRTAA